MSPVSQERERENVQTSKVSHWPKREGTHGALRGISMRGACRYEVLDNSSQTLRGGAQDIARDLLEATLDVAAGLLSAETAQLAPPLCQVLTSRRTDCMTGWTVPHFHCPESFLSTCV